MKRLLFAVALLSLGGCANPLSSSSPSAVTAKLTSLQQYTVADLQDSLTNAQAQQPPDLAGEACWQTLLGAVSSLAVPPGAGLAYTIQLERDFAVAEPIILRACNNIITFP